MINLTSENFESEVLQSDQTVLIDFYADWCGPCRMMSPVIDDIAKELEGKVPNATGELQVWGLDEFDDSNMKYRIVVETKPNEQYGAQRFLRSEFKKGLDKRNIKVSYPQIEVHNGK